jgi:ABC-type oligopeptide transport system substrate-binding subunit
MSQLLRLMIWRKMFRRLKPALLLLALMIGVLAGCNSNDLSSSNTTKTPVASAPPDTAYPMPPTKGATINNLGWTFAGGRRNDVVRSVPAQRAAFS